MLVGPFGNEIDPAYDGRDMRSCATNDVLDCRRSVGVDIKYHLYKGLDMMQIHLVSS